MSVDIKDKAEVEKRLWHDVAESRIGMLGAVGLPIRHFHPMSAFAEPEAGKIWFFTNADTELAMDARDGVPAMFVVMTKDQDLQACIGGELRVTTDALHRDKYWNAVVAAWFPKGKEDPGTTLLCLTCKDAQVWISDNGPVKFGWEIAKANLTATLPDVGGHAELELS